MRRGWPALLLLCAWLIPSWACAPEPNLATDLKVIPTMTGYADVGPTPDRQNKIVPAITFQLKNEGTLPITNVDLVANYWQVGDDGEKDSVQIRGIGNTPLEPGATSEPITVRASLGYTHPGPRTDMFTNSLFKGFVVKMFAKRAGKTTKLCPAPAPNPCEFPVEARLLPAVRKDGSHP